LALPLLTPRIVSRFATPAAGKIAANSELPATAGTISFMMSAGVFTKKAKVEGLARVKATARPERTRQSPQAEIDDDIIRQVVDDIDDDAFEHPAPPLLTRRNAEVGSLVSP